MNLGVVGSRYFKDYDFVEKHINAYIKIVGKPINIISGGALGVDTLAKEYAKKNNINFIEYKADWKKYGKSAGPKRNTLIVEASTHIIAFPSRNGKGTQNTIKQAMIKKIKPRVVYID